MNYVLALSTSSSLVSYTVSANHFLEKAIISTVFGDIIAFYLWLIFICFK